MDLRHQLAAFRGYVPLVIVCAAIAAIAAYVGSGALPRSYEAKSTLIVGQSLSAVNPDYGQLLASQRLSTTYADIATTRPLLVDVIAKLGLATTPDLLEKRVHATAALDSTLLSITASDRDPAVAAAIANGLAEGLVNASPTLGGQEADIRAFVNNELSATQAQIETVQADITRQAAITNRTAAQEAQLSLAQGRLTTLRSSYVALLAFASNDVSNRVTIVEPAVAPVDAVWPRPLLNAALAGVLAVLLAMFIVIVITFLDDTVKDADQVRDTVGLPTLGGVPRSATPRSRAVNYLLVMLLYPRSAASEAYRTLRTNLEFAAVDAPLEKLLVTSAGPGEGKTVTAANLAIAFAQAGRRVLLVDADFRKPGVDAMFRVSNSIGLSNLLRSDSTTWKNAVQPTEEANLMVLTTGPQPPNPAELIASRRMATVIGWLQAGYDLIVIDSPPLLVVTDSAILSTIADGVLLVFDVKRTGRDDARRGTEALRKAGARVLGVVLNSQPASDFTAYAAYYGGSTAEPETLATIAASRESSD